MALEKNLERVAKRICSNVGLIPWERLTEEGVKHYTRRAEVVILGHRYRQVVRVRRIMDTNLFPETKLRRIKEILDEEI